MKNYQNLTVIILGILGITDIIINGGGTVCFLLFFYGIYKFGMFLLKL